MLLKVFCLCPYIYLPANFNNIRLRERTDIYKLGLEAQFLVWYNYWYLLSRESTEFIVCKSRSCSTLELVVISTNMQHVTLKSPKMSNDNDKKWMFCAIQKLHLLVLANLQSNKRLKKETLRFSHWFFVYMHLSKREIFHSYKKSRKFFTFFTFLDQSSCIKS